MTAGEIVCAREPGLPVAEFCRVLAESGLGATRPLDDAARMRQMLAGAALVMTARDPRGTLLGVARCLTDGAWIAYLAELAVARQAQGRGVGRRLLHAVRDELGPQVSLVLASVPEAVAFYEKVGMPRMPDVFQYRRQG
jgi:ribosomal protein S18 acetylase RimI-like enzyme